MSVRMQVSVWVGVCAVVVYGLLHLRPWADSAPVTPLADLPRESGHLYGTPRLHFSGRFRARTASLNNDIRDYITGNDPGITDAQVNMSTAYAWSKWGSNSFSLADCPVTAAVPPRGTPHRDGADAALLSSIVGGPPGRIVDLDPQQQMVSQIWGLWVNIGDDGLGNSLLSGYFEPAGFNLAEFAPTKTVTLHGDPAYGAAWQSVLRNVTFAKGQCDDAATAAANPTLCGLRDVAKASGDVLAIRLTVDGYIADSTNGNFNTGQVQGVIGPYTPGEPQILARAHHLYVSVYGGPYGQPIAAHVSVMATRDSKLHWALDLGTTVQYQTAGEVLSQAMGAWDYVLQVDTGEAGAAQFHTIGTVTHEQLASPDFRAKHGSIVHFYTDASPESVAWAGSRLRLVRAARASDPWSVFNGTGNPWDPATTYNPNEFFALESPTGELAVFERMFARLYEHDSTTWQAYVTRFGHRVTEGVPLTWNFNPSTDMSNWIYPAVSDQATPLTPVAVTELAATHGGFQRRFRITAPSIMVPCGDIHFDKIANQKTDNTKGDPTDGFGPTDLQAAARRNCPVCSKPGYQGLVPARCHLGVDSFAYYVNMSSPNMPGDRVAWLGGLLVWHKEPVAEAPTWLDDILPIFRSSRRLYPVMDSFVDLGDYGSVTQPRMLSSLQRAFGADVHDAHYMPVTRDLAPDKAAMVQRWLQFPAYAVRPRTDSATDPSTWSLAHVVDRLRKMLLVEHATVPLYLSALYSIKKGHLGSSSELIGSVAHQEMQHMAMVANILIALGEAPHIATDVPRFPTALPLNLVGGRVLKLAPLSAEVLDTFLEIEHSDQFTTDCSTIDTTHTCTLTVPAAHEVDTAAATIAEAYLGIRQALIALEARAQAAGSTIFVGPADKGMSQAASAEVVVAVSNLTTALQAIDMITTEGEGASLAEQHGNDGDWSHYLRFLEVRYQGSVRSVTRNGSGDAGAQPSTYTVTFYDDPPPTSTFPFADHVHAAKPCGEAQPSTCKLTDGCSTFDRRVSELYVSVLNAVEEVVLGHGEDMGKAVGLMRQMHIAVDAMMDPVNHLYQPHEKKADYNCSFLPSFHLP